MSPRHDPRPDPWEIVDLAGGFAVVTLPLFILAVPAVVLLVPLVLLLVPLVVLGLAAAVVVVPPLVAVRAIRARRRRTVSSARPGRRSIVGAARG